MARSYPDWPRALRRTTAAAHGLYEKIAASHPKLARGQVWCRHCDNTQRVDAAHALRFGWPKCCGHTMTIDPPEEW